MCNPTPRVPGVTDHATCVANPVTGVLKPPPSIPTHTNRCHSWTPGVDWQPRPGGAHHTPTWPGLYEDLPELPERSMTMSAADPATPDRPFLNGLAHGAVIDITARRHRGATVEARGRWTAMTTPPAHGPERTDLEQVADFYESWFNAVKRTLADQETAAVYLRTVDVFEHILKGAVAQDLITEEQRIQLTDLLDAARHAPGIVAG